MTNRIECCFCGETPETTELRQYHDSAGYFEQDYVCEECFRGTDTGPCFDDLPKVKMEEVKK